MRIAVLNNYLVNPSGRPGHWLELDLLQEHFNFWLKRLFNSKSLDFDGKHLSEAVGLNIRGFSSLRKIFPGLFGLKKNSPGHTPAKTADDLDALGVHYGADKILSFVKHRHQDHEIINEFAEGFNILESGQLQTFLDRTTPDGPVPEDNALENDGLQDIGGEDYDDYVPSAPITFVDGTINISVFVTGE